MPDYSGYNTESFTLNSVTTVSGSELPGAYTSIGETMVLIFYTDEIVTKSGFEIAYEITGDSEGERGDITLILSLNIPHLSLSLSYCV